MKGFIEVHIPEDNVCLISVSKISTIVPNDSNDGSVSVIVMNNCDTFIVKEAYTEVKRLIEQAKEG